MQDALFSVVSEWYDSVKWEISAGKLSVTISGDTLILKPSWTTYACDGVNKSLYLEDANYGKVLEVVC